jgi:hypothetical protein
MNMLFWIVLDLIPFFVAFQLHPPVVGFSVGLLLTLAIRLFQKRRFGEVNTIIKVKILYFFCSLAIAILFPDVRLFDFTQLFVYGILTLTTILSLLVKKPFTLQYAKKTVAPQFHDQPLFVSANYWLTAAWALSFGLSFAFAVLYTLNVIPGEIGIMLVHTWNILGFVVTFLVRFLGRQYYLKQKGSKTGA